MREPESGYVDVSCSSVIALLDVEVVIMTEGGVAIEKQTYSSHRKLVRES